MLKNLAAILLLTVSCSGDARDELLEKYFPGNNEKILLLKEKTDRLLREIIPNELVFESGIVAFPLGYIRAVSCLSKSEIAYRTTGIITLKSDKEIYALSIITYLESGETHYLVRPAEKLKLKDSVFIIDLGRPVCGLKLKNAPRREDFLKIQRLLPNPQFRLIVDKSGWEPSSTENMMENTQESIGVHEYRAPLVETWNLLEE